MALLPKQLLAVSVPSISAANSTTSSFYLIRAQLRIAPQIPPHYAMSHFPCAKVKDKRFQYSPQQLKCILKMIRPTELGLWLYVSTCAKYSYMEHLLSSFLRPPHFKFSMQHMPRIKAAFPNVQLCQHCEGGIPFTFYLTHPSQPTIIYVHSYNSSRHEVNTLLPSMLAGNFNVATIDLQRVNTEYAPSNNKHIDKKGIITFGYYEFEQIRTVVMFLSRTINPNIILWGRSMGAACIINYQYKYRDAKCIILDSPFSDLRDAFIKRLSATIPQCICSAILALMTSSINSFARVNLLGMNFLGKMDPSTPTIFIHNKHDPISGCQELYNACKTHHKMLLFTETHHCDQREPQVIEDIFKILGNYASPITQRQEKSLYSTSISLTPRPKKVSFDNTDYLDRSVEMTHSATDHQLTSCQLNSIQWSRESKSQTGRVRAGLPQTTSMRVTICSNKRKRLVRLKEC